MCDIQKYYYADNQLAIVVIMNGYTYNRESIIMTPVATVYLQYYPHML